MRVPTLSRVAPQWMLRRWPGMLHTDAPAADASPEPDCAAPTDADDLFRRVCNCDLRAYTQRTDKGYSQGFVLVRDYAPPGPVQRILPAGVPQPHSAVALGLARAKLEELSALVAQHQLRMGQDEHSI